MSHMSAYAYVEDIYDKFERHLYFKNVHTYILLDYCNFSYAALYCESEFLVKCECT